MSGTTFIYALCEPDTGAVRYVGKSNDPQERLGRHLRDRDRNHRTNWILSLLARGLKPVLEILDEVPVSEWPQWEVAYIAFYREEGYDLVNGNAGGEGGHYPSKEVREKIGSKNRGRKRTPEEKLNLSAKNSGKNNPHYGKPRPESVKKVLKALAEARVGKPLTEGHRRKLSEAKLGKPGNPHNEKSRRSISRSVTLMWGRLTPEQRAERIARATRRKILA